MTLVDSNVLLDVLTDGQTWGDWSQFRLDEAAARGSLVINDVIFAEISVRYSSVKEVFFVLRSWKVEIIATPMDALFLAGKVFLRYRQAGGVRTGVLSDFFIGAHAAVADIPLLTRDARRYRSYFPAIELIAP